MKTFGDMIREKRENSNTVEEWSKAFDWLAERALDMYEGGLLLESKIIEKYGEDELTNLLTSDAPKQVREVSKEELEQITNDLLAEMFPPLD